MLKLSDLISLQIFIRPLRLVFQKILLFNQKRKLSDHKFQGGLNDTLVSVFILSHNHMLFRFDTNI